MDDKIPAELKDLMSYLRKRNIETYVVGGAVRDLLVGKTPSDWDLATPVIPEELMESLKRSRTYRVIPTGIEHGTVTIITPGNVSFEVTTFREDVVCDGRRAEVKFITSLEEDLSRRDFTINAMALDHTGNVLDPLGGQEDLLKNRYIRPTRDPQILIEEDRLRMMRACRFAAYNEGMIITQGLFSAIRNNAASIKEVSEERIRDELIKLMKYKYPSKGFNSLKNTKLLDHVLPELSNCVGVAQNKHHKDDVYKHILMVVDAVPQKYTLLRFGALFHDIAKPDTKETQKSGYVSFHNHEVVGATKAYEAMKRLKFPNEWCTQVVTFVRYHMWRFTDETKDSTIKKWASTVHPHTRDLLRLRMADRKGNRAKIGRPSITYAMKKLLRKLLKFEKEKVPMTRDDLVIDGKDLIKMGVKPGPKFRTILDACLDMVLECPEYNSREFLLGFIKGRFRV